MSLLRIAIVGTLIATGINAGYAGEWQAERLRGVVLMMIDGEWQPIARGDVIEDSRVIRTGANGQVTFRSGQQVIELKRNTQIQVSAIEDRDHTWILHAGGQLTADVDARDVEHFGVRTHHIVAVVKGTRFTVSAEPESASVGVERGSVSVNESGAGLSVQLAAGQQASGGGGQLSVSGEGNLPTVRDASGRAVVPPTPTVSMNQNAASAVEPRNSAAATITGVPAPDRSPEAQGNAASAPGRSGEAPGNAGNAPGRSGERGNSANAPGQNGGSPGNSGNAPGHSNSSPGNSGNASGQSGGAPGNSGNAPGQSGGSPGNSGNAPGQSGGAPGNAGNASDHNGGSPGNSGSAPGHSGSAPGNSGNAHADSSGGPGNSGSARGKPGKS